MLTPLTKAIWAALIVWTTGAGEPVGTKWCRPNCMAVAAEQAETIERVASEHDVNPWALAALAHSESGFNPEAFGILGEVGIFQVHPKSRWGRAARESCRVDPEHCDYWRAYWGAKSFADGLAECGDEHGAIGFHKTGKCKRGPAGARILRRARRMAKLGGDHGSR